MARSREVIYLHLLSLDLLARNLPRLHRSRSLPNCGRLPGGNFRGGCLLDCRLWGGLHAGLLRCGTLLGLVSCVPGGSLLGTFGGWFLHCLSRRCLLWLLTGGGWLLCRSGAPLGGGGRFLVYPELEPVRRMDNHTLNSPPLWWWTDP